jgi:hypothetical protein
MRIQIRTVPAAKIDRKVTPEEKSYFKLTMHERIFDKMK